MYWDEGDHWVPHFHAHYAGQRASISLEGAVLAGHLHGRALGFGRDWALLHHEELMADWERARRAEPLVPIAALP